MWNVGAVIAAKYIHCEAYKTHHSFFNHNLKKSYPILTIFVDTWHNWPSNDRLVFHSTQHLLLHYLEKTKQTKCALKSTKNFIKFHLSRYVATNSQSITRFDCCAAARVLNWPNIQEYWWIQETTGEVWIGLEQNVIDPAINEWRKCVRAEPMFVGQHFKHLCRQLKMTIR